MVNKLFKLVKCHKQNSFYMFLDAVQADYCSVYAMEERERQVENRVAGGKLSGFWQAGKPPSLQISDALTM
jgi:hypothetical protein